MASIYILKRFMEYQNLPLLEASDLYVFGSLLSRNTTYRLMHHVWLKSADPDSSEDTPISDNSEPGTSDEPAPPPPSPMPDAAQVDLALRRLSRRKSEIFPRISAKAVRRQCPSSSVDSVVDQITLSECNWDCSKGKDCFNRAEENVPPENNGLPKSTLVLLAATMLLVALFLFATVLVYRVSITKAAVVEENMWQARASHKIPNYLELLKQQQEAVESEIRRITTTLKIRMEELGQVRRSIDRLMGVASGKTCQAAAKESEEQAAEKAT